MAAGVGAELYEMACGAADAQLRCAIHCMSYCYDEADMYLTMSQTGGYDGSMLNGLNILPSYTDYFQLTDATTGLNTGSVFIGGVLGPAFSGVIADRYGRRPAMFWGAIVMLIGVVLQTAAQNIAMFVIARIVLGVGTAVSGIAASVYLSETFPSRWRAWGVGVLNNFY